MSGAKYFVWAEGRWRELDVSGSVQGWSRRPRFVFVRRGKLRVAARRRVLAALEAHAAHSAGAIRLGSRLSARSIASAAAHTRPKRPAEAPVPPSPSCAHQHCCMHYNGCNNNNHFSKSCGDSAASGVARRCDAATQHRGARDAAVQHAPRDTCALTINLANSAPPPPRAPATTLAPRSADKPPAAPTDPQARSRAPPLDSLLDKHASPAKRARPVDTPSDDSADNFKKPTKVSSSADTEQSQRRATKEPRNNTISSGFNKRDKSQRSDSECSATSRSDVCKELTISETDVSALRSFVARTRSSALARFDADDGYKRALFYAINPLVDVARCPRTERALREHHDIARAHFAARLGLAPHGTARPPPKRRRRAHAHYRDRSSSGDTDKENRHATRTAPAAHNAADTRAHTHAVAQKTVPQTKHNTHNSDRNEPKQRSSTSRNKRDSLSPNASSKHNVEDSDKERDEAHSSRDKRTSLRSATRVGEPATDGKRETNRRASERNRDSLPRRSATNTHRYKEHSANDDNQTKIKKSNNNKRDSQRIKTDTRTKPTVEHSESDESVQKSGYKRNSLKSKNDTRSKHNEVDTDSDDSTWNSSDKRDSLRSKTDARTKRIVKDSESEELFQKSRDSKRDSSRSKHYRRTKHNKKHSESEESDQNSSDNKRNSQRSKTNTRPKRTVEESDSDESVEMSSENKRDSLRTKTNMRSKPGRESNQSSAESHKSSDHKRHSSRKQTAMQAHAKVIHLESDSDSERETAKKRSQTKSGNILTKPQSTSSASSSKRAAGRPAVKHSDSDGEVFKPTRPASGSSKSARPKAQTSASAADPAKEDAPTHTISKRASAHGANEYSNLEDHAIVSWVSVGGRARLVNGNRLWRELQEQFERVGGRARSWHSLRNRYLRYILPSLGALRLPPAHVSRLRAAAATGELKSKRGDGAPKSWRNSIFNRTIVRAASSRRPQAQPDVEPATSPEPTPAPASTPPPARATASSSTSDEEEPAPAPAQTRRSLRARTSDVPAPPAPPPRSAPPPSGARTSRRKLFNPSMVL